MPCSAASSSVEREAPTGAAQGRVHGRMSLPDCGRSARPGPREAHNRENGRMPVITIELEIPDDLARFRLPPSVQARLQALLDRQDEGIALTNPKTSVIYRANLSQSNKI